MEMLTPFVEYLGSHKLSRNDVLNLGISVCKALELCKKQNIIHRDIKPANIFVSPNGDYKLGDFGIARIISKTTGASTKVGTNDYMAPEVYRGEIYGETVDIYSLGLVLYRLLNNNRMPFLPPAPAPITHSQREEAVSKRMQGIEFPAPINAEEEIVNVIKKATAYKPEDRYQNPTDMREELESILSGHQSRAKELEPVIEVEEEKTEIMEDDKTVLFEEEKTEVKPKIQEEHKESADTSDIKTKSNKKSKTKWIIAIASVIVLVIAIIAIVNGSNRKSVEDVEQVYVADTESKENSDDSNETDMIDEDTETWVFLSDNSKVNTDLKSELLDRAGAKESEIVMFHKEDFDGDGKEEAFAIIGEIDGNSEYDLVDGSIWFVGPDSCIQLRESEGKNLHNSDRVMKFGETQYVLFDFEYATGIPTYVWYVSNSQVQQALFSGIGGVVPVTDGRGDFRIVYEDYDALYDTLNNLKLGHTWKSYYFYYDESDKQIYEYGGLSIDNETAENYCGTYLTDLMKPGDQLDGYLWHDNGLIVMNFERHDGTDVRYYHYILDTVTFGLVDDAGGNNTSEEPLEGMYLKTIVPTMVKYPVSPSH